MSRFSVILAASILALAGCDSPQDNAAQRETAAQGAEAPVPPPLPGKIVRAQAGTELPDLSFEDPAGNTLDLGALDGQPVLVNLWATWCAPCVIEMPLLDELAGELGDDVRVLTISQDVRGAEVVEPFFAERDFEHLEQWLDPQSEMAFRFSQGGLLPTTILFDGEGREVFRVAGDYEWNSEEAIAAIREGLAE